MDDLATKNAMRSLVKEAIELIRKSGDGLDPYHGGLAGYNPMRDEPLIGLPSFQEASTTLSEQPNVQKHYGQGESVRLSLQFIYGILTKLEKPSYDQGLFDQLWTEYVQELEQTEWVFFGVTNLYNFDSTDDRIDLGDGIQVQLIDSEFMETLRWNVDDLMQLRMNIGSFGFATHALVVRHSLKKSPNNVVLSGTPELEEKIKRALLTLRLLKAGDVSVGHVFHVRPSPFSYAGGGGRTVDHTGQSSSFPSHPHYELMAADIPDFRVVYDQLMQFEKFSTEKWENIAYALRAFSAMYGRVLGRPGDRVLDGNTALEALLTSPNKPETSFAIAFRGASLLADTDNERSRYFSNLKTYYKARNGIIHLGADESVQQHIVPLQETVRRLLRGFLALALKRQDDQNNFYGQLDAYLLHTVKREKLRQDMGLRKK